MKIQKEMTKGTEPDIGIKIGRYKTETKISCAN
jgi:hypothetical protein